MERQYEAMDRRTFLSRAGGLGFLMLSGVGVGVNGEDAQAVEGVWILASDTHVPADRSEAYRGFRPYEHFATVAQQFQQVPAQGCIITGDLARLQGLEGDYENLFELARPVADRFPLYLCLGNHDDRGNILKHLESAQGRASVSGKLVYSTKSNGVRFLMLDSLLSPNLTPGLLGKNQRTWLRSVLEEDPDSPTVLFFHHTLGDGDGDLLDGDRLFALVAEFPQVKAMVYGHSHAYSVTERAGIQLINLPAVGYNFNDAHAIGWVLARFSPTGVDLTLKTIAGNREAHDEVRTVRWA
jgi:3',5'-cyclic AMP phosphodiesterase CpdA